MAFQSGRGNPSWPLLVRTHSHTVAWIPAADVYQISSGWIVKLELAGVRKEDVSVSVEGNAVRVRGRRLDQVACETDRCHSLEIVYDRFERRFELSRPLDRYRVITEYRDGMLLVKIVAEEPEE